MLLTEGKYPHMSASAFLRSLIEMPEFARVGKKAVDTETGVNLRDLPLEAVDDNLLMWHNEKDTFFFSAGFTMVWFFRSEESAKAAVQTKGYCPPMFADFVNMSDRFSGRSPIKDIWSKRRGSKEHSTLDAEVVGALRAQVDEESIYIDMVSVRPGWKRNSIASKMVEALKARWAGKKVDHSDTTSDGHKFLKATGNLAHDKADGGHRWSDSTTKLPKAPPAPAET